MRRRGALTLAALVAWLAAASAEMASGEVAASQAARLRGTQASSEAASAVETSLTLLQTKATNDEGGEDLDVTYMAQVLNKPVLSQGGPFITKRSLPLVPLDPMQYKDGVQPIHLGVQQSLVDKMYDTEHSEEEEEGQEEEEEGDEESSFMQVGAHARSSSSKDKEDAKEGNGEEQEEEGPLADEEAEKEAELEKQAAEAQGTSDTEFRIINGYPRPHGLWTRFPAHKATPMPPVDPQSALGGVVRLGIDDVRPMKVKKGLFGMFGFLEVRAAARRAARRSRATHSAATAAASTSRLAVTGQHGAVHQRTLKPASSAHHHATASAPASSASHRFHGVAHTTTASAAHHHTTTASAAHHHTSTASAAHHTTTTASAAHHHTSTASAAHHHTSTASAAHHHTVAASAAHHHHRPTAAKAPSHSPRFRQRRVASAPGPGEELHPWGLDMLPDPLGDRKRAMEASKQLARQQRAAWEAAARRQKVMREAGEAVQPRSHSQQRPGETQAAAETNAPRFRALRSSLIPTMSGRQEPAPVQQQQQQQVPATAMPAAASTAFAAPTLPSASAPFASSLPDNLATTNMPDDESFQRFRSVLDMGIASPVPAAALQGSQTVFAPAQTSFAATPALTGIASDLAGNTLAGIGALQLPPDLTRSLQAAVHSSAPFAQAMRLQQQQQQQQQAALRFQQQQQQTGQVQTAPVPAMQANQQLLAQLQLQAMQQQQAMHTEAAAPSAQAVANQRFRQGQQQAKQAAAKQAARKQLPDVPAAGVGLTEEQVGAIHSKAKDVASPSSQRAFRDVLADVGLKAGSMEPSVL